MPRLLTFTDREPRPDAIDNPEIAQFHLWLAQIQRDHGNLGGHDMRRMEMTAQPMARRARTMFNPFTGEIRRYEDIADHYDPNNILHRLAKERG
jgi:hypothetical protein